MVVIYTIKSDKQIFEKMLETKIKKHLGYGKDIVLEVTVVI